MQMGFYFNQELCWHCSACLVACKDWHDVPPGPGSYIRIAVIEKGKFPDVFMAAMFHTCYHCAEPACVEACPVEAITKREEDGIVVVDPEECLGMDNCGACKDQCPYGAPQSIDVEDAKMQKCDLCQDRLSAGKDPICVGACNTFAIAVGPLDELRKKYGDVRQAEGFEYDEALSPSIIFKPMIDKKNRTVQKTLMIPGGN